MQAFKVLITESRLEGLKDLPQLGVEGINGTVQSDRPGLVAREREAHGQPEQGVADQRPVADALAGPEGIGQVLVRHLVPTRHDMGQPEGLQYVRQGALVVDRFGCRQCRLELALGRLEALGYHVGTELLRRAVENLGQVLPVDAGIGRVDGDELVVIADVGRAEGPSRADADTRAEALAEILRDAIIAGRYLVNDIEVSLRANVGLAIAPWDGSDIAELIRRASLSAQQAAAQGRAHVIWSGDEGVLTAGDLALLSRLRLASENDEFSLAYQPQVSTKTMRIVSARGSPALGLR